MHDWQMVIGLETHIELLTETKAFCSCVNRYGAAPNTLVCPMCMGLPGAMPSLNRQAVRLAVMAGYALHCEVHAQSRFDRKNYFYPDLPKAYQITQYYEPLCEHGYLDIETDGQTRRIGITRIHMEEDAGKLRHEDGRTLLDLNRCGVPLIEIVTEPDLRSPQEAAAYLRELRAVLTFAGISRCRMNEGSLRCDVNLSIHRSDEPFGERCEIKNLNSFQHVERAIQAEFERQRALRENNLPIRRQTLRFDEKSGKTIPMRDKESTNDYRYFPEPDLPPLRLGTQQLLEMRQALPKLPEHYRHVLQETYRFTAAMTMPLCREKWLAEYTLQTAALCRDATVFGHLMIGEGLRLMAKNDRRHDGEYRADDWPIAPERMAALCNLLSDRLINNNSAKELLGRLYESDFDPVQTAHEEGYLMLRDARAIRELVSRVLQENEPLVVTWLGGKHKVEQALLGKCMAKAGGRLDMRLADEELKRQLCALENG